MQRLLNWILGRSPRKPPQQQCRRVRLLLEQLEQRLTPSTYAWKGGNQGDPTAWEEAKNWSSSDGGTSYPQTTSDIAQIDNNIKGECTLSTAQDISQLKLSSILNLGANLTLENGGSMYFNNVFRPIWMHNTAAITLKTNGGVFDWTDGNINTATADTKGTLDIEGGTFKFHTSSGGHGFGNDITVGSTTNSKLILGNSDVVTLYCTFRKKL